MSIGIALLGGFILLLGGGEVLVRGAARFSKTIGISPLMIGLTVVGFGTSMPELVTSIEAAIVGAPAIAVGNIIGSNLANSLLILGLAALAAPLAVETAALNRDCRVVMIASALLLAAGFTTGLGRIAGSLFLLLLLGYVIFAYRQEKQAANHAADIPMQPTERYSAAAVAMPLLPILLGMGGVIFGAQLLVQGAIALAELAGLSHALIGLTIVAVGTSLPELVTSIVAAIRKQGQLALGNVLGSNIFNIFGIGGVTGMVAPGPVPSEMAEVELPLLVVVTLLIVMFAISGREISRREGSVLVLAYLLYLAYAINRA
ncbi:MAG: calcium/sodium antiporter [Ferrovibrio sp.]|uniref:calcium/sodium antiporter n=1 Tax=Ferrovibrio sp. TaxID=1917215 RepID=UPI003918D096